MVTPAARREAVAHLRVAYEVSERRACSALGADRTSVRYRSSRPNDAVVRVRLRELASIRRRFGYRRLHILLTREGIAMNHKNPPTVPRGTAAGAPTWRAQACFGNQGADGDPTGR
jgi:putative transposase